MKQKFILIVLLFVLGNIVVAQPESDGFSKLNQKEFAAARRIFTAMLKINPETQQHGMAWENTTLKQERLTLQKIVIRKE